MIGCITAVVVAMLTNMPQPVVIGPFPLIDLILSDPKDNWLVKDFKAAGVDIDDVRKEARGWKVSFIEYRVRGKDGRWEWYRPENREWSFPKAVVEGRMSIKVKDGQGETAEIVLTECKLVASSTWINWNAKGEPPFVRGRLGITLRFHDFVVPEGDGIVGRPKEGSLAPPVRYDITGYTSFGKPEEK